MANSTEPTEEEQLLQPAPKIRHIHFKKGNISTTPEENIDTTNAVKNTKYNKWTFLPKTIYNQFKYFNNLFFLLLALTQFVKVLSVGFLFTYVSPLIIILMLSGGKELFEHIGLLKSDRQVNEKEFQIMDPSGELKKVQSQELRVGDILHLKSGDEIPCDCLLLRSSEKNGTCFISTMQLDGEQDYKLRRALSLTQPLTDITDVFKMKFAVQYEQPRKEIYDFVGRIEMDDGTMEPLSLENTLWGSTTVKSGNHYVMVLYTGVDTRTSQNKAKPVYKFGVFDAESNRMSKQLFGLLVCLSIVLLIFRGFNAIWYVYLIRYIVILASIIPTSMKVNQDLSRILFKREIEKGDPDLENCILRNSNLAEELGRISFLCSDKTGTLTQNVMEVKKLNTGNLILLPENSKELGEIIRNHDEDPYEIQMHLSPELKAREALMCLLLCHNVTPVEEDGTRVLQASSPDEIALVEFAEKCGYRLKQREIDWMDIVTPAGTTRRYKIEHVFPFSSARKRMGIVLRDTQTNIIYYYLKGADSIMFPLVDAPWITSAQEAVEHYSREGLRTLVFSGRILSEAELEAFSALAAEADAALIGRQEKTNAAIATLENNMVLLAVSGVEDKLQEGVRPSLEFLRNAGIRIWVLTGDKSTTAMTIARSSCLVSRTMRFFIFKGGSNSMKSIAKIKNSGYQHAIVIEGSTISYVLKHHKEVFIKCALRCPIVLASRCSPTQKAELVALLIKYSGKRVAAIGDGGNDCAMISTAHLGVGLEGKEGSQASLTGDISLKQFSHLTRVLFYGRKFYNNACNLSNFVGHRGLLISYVCFLNICCFYFSAVSAFSGTLLFCFTSVYLVFPVFALALDNDITPSMLSKYPQLYRPNRSLINIKSFITWNFISLFQASIAFFVGLLWFGKTTNAIQSVVFTALVLTEIFNIAVEVRTWTKWMVISEVGSVIIYIVSIFFLPFDFDLTFIMTKSFLLGSLISFAISFIPVFVVTLIDQRINTPPEYML
ncbi:hypothetical protein PCE1_000560 [Barthelona sp. PCE]